MSGPLIITDTDAYTVDAANSTASFDSTRFPLSNLTDRVHPLRVYKSPQNTGVGTINLSIIPTTGVTIAGIFVDNLNINGSITFTTKTSGYSTTDSLGSKTITQDTFTDRGKVFYRFSTPLYFDGTTRKYIRLDITGTGFLPEDTVGYIQVGAISIYELQHEYEYPGGAINDVEYLRNDPVEITKFEGGSLEYNSVGQPFTTISIPSRIFLEDTQVETVHDILKARATPVIFYENNLNISRAYTSKIDLQSGIRLKYLVTGKAFEAQLSFIECI